MKKKWLHGRIIGSVMALLLALSLSISPVSSMLASAETTSDGIVLKVTENDLTFEKGSVPDLAQYFTVYYNGEEVYALYDYNGASFYFTEDYDDPDNYPPLSETLTLHYYGEDGEELSEAPTEVGSYTVQAECTAQVYYLYSEEGYSSGDTLTYFYAIDYGYKYYSSETLSYTITEPEPEADLSVTAKSTPIEVYETGEPVDLTSYFEIKYKGEIPDLVFEGYLDENRQYTSYYNYSDKWCGEEGYEPLANLLEMHYYKVNADGTPEELDSAPSELGSYQVRAVIPDITDQNGLYAIYPTYETGTESCDFYYEGAQSKLIDFTISKEPKGLWLVYGDEELPDEDALVLTIFGDGFTEDEQAAFYQQAKKTAEYVMSISPWDEFKDVVKFYAYGTVSNESGIKGDKAQTQLEANKDTRDTYLGTYFWTNGMQRLTTLSDSGAQKIEEILRENLPSSDYTVVLLNSETYGGSGGEYCLASLNSEALDIMVHELGHTVGDLLDEYWADGYEEEKKNMTQHKPGEEEFPYSWGRFYGKNGIGLYPYEDGGEKGLTWYHPSSNCKMQYLAKDFCDVCKEALRQAICKDSNVTKLFFQTYGDSFYEPKDGKGIDMKECFIIRRGSNETTLDQLENVTMTYYDADGNELESAPYQAGTYTVKAQVKADGTYEACEQTGTYTIESIPITVSAESKTYDGQAAEITYEIGWEQSAYAEANCTVEVSYTGTLPGWYSQYSDKTYASNEAPFQPGEYTATVTVKDKETGETITKASKDFDIEFRKTDIVNNDSWDYIGAINYYNNRTIVIAGDGFTEDDQDEFEAKAQEYVDYILSQEPFRELKLYFNFTAVNVISEESGIGNGQAADTYFQLYLDEDGKLQPSHYSPTYAARLSYYEVTPYYAAAIIIANDDTDTSGIRMTGDYPKIIFGNSSESSKEYVVNELLNTLAGYDVGYRAQNDEDKAAQRTALLNKLYYEAGEDDSDVLYCMPLITSTAYNEKFVENGEPIDLSPYFHTYILGEEVTAFLDKDDQKIEPMSDAYIMHYYKVNEDGSVDEKELDGAPAAAGTYLARAEILDMNAYDADNVLHWIPGARGEVVYTIHGSEVSSDEPVADPDEPIAGPEDGSSGTDTKDATDTAENESASAKTGDSAPIALYIVLIAACGIVAAVIAQKRKKNA